MNSPKRTELHRHLDAAFRSSTLAELVKKHHLKPEYLDGEDVRNKFWVTEQRSSLKEVLDCFTVFQKVLSSEEIIERVGFEAAEDVYLEGTGAVELRYSPSFVSEFTHMNWDVVLHAFERGLKRAREKYDLHVGLICIVSRDYGLEMAHKTVDFALEHKKAFVGIDLAGNEALFPNKLFKAPFQKVHAAKMPVTIHAGEALGPESVWDAIELLGAHRIGHGISSARDAELMKRLAKDGILLETCPSSNYICKAVQEWKDHPLPRFLEAGIPVSISTDDPGIFGVSLDEEYRRVQKFLKLSASDLEKLDAYSNKHSFLSSNYYR